jgi:hypothetical protein
MATGISLIGFAAISLRARYMFPAAMLMCFGAGFSFMGDLYIWATKVLPSC